MKIAKRLLWVLITVLYISLTAVVVFSAGLPADNLIVSNTNDSGSGSLRQAITDANPGSTITFDLPPNSTIKLTSGPLQINKDLTINGPQPSETPPVLNDSPNNEVAIDGGKLIRLFEMLADNQISMSWLDLMNGNADDQTLAAGFGGAIYLAGSTLNGQNLFFGGNSAQFAGGAIYNNGGTVTLSNSHFQSNETTNDQSFGGAIANVGAPGFDANLTINQVRIEDNQTILIGGGISNISQNSNSSVQATNLICAHNSAEEGGCAYNGKIGTAGNATFSLDGANLYNNTAQTGGGLENVNGNMQIIDTIFSQNWGEKTGSAIASNGDTDIKFTIVQTNVVSPSIPTNSALFTPENGQQINFIFSVINNDTNCLNENTINNMGYNLINNDQCFPDGQNNSEVQTSIKDWIRSAERKDLTNGRVLESVPTLWVDIYDDFIPSVEIPVGPAFSFDYRGLARPIGDGATPGPLEAASKVVIHKSVIDEQPNDDSFQISFSETNSPELSSPMTQMATLKNGQSTTFRPVLPLVSGQSEIIISEPPEILNDYQVQIVCDNGISVSGNRLELTLGGEQTIECTIINRRIKPINLYMPIIIK